MSFLVLKLNQKTYSARQFLFKRELSSFPKSYTKDIEKNVYEGWESSGAFQPKASNDGNFSMILPPPNVTGTLHIGHALTISIQDAVARHQRMLGKKVLWVPGTDHAGIATQAVVNREIQHKLKQTSNEIGREKFLQCVWDWKNSKSVRINEQMRKLGASLDWSKEIFTLDELQSNSVMEALFKLWDKGLIYRDETILNWSCALKTTISDIEVEHVLIDGPTKISVQGFDEPVVFGQIIDFSYKIQDSNEEIIVSTTRVETMLGDVAVAVHPDDDRYINFIGKNVIHPFNGCVLPVISDDTVDPKFGTGAVKITPAHDPKDFLIAKRHNLPIKTVINENGYLSDKCFEFSGIHRFHARQTLIKALEEKGLLRSIKPHSFQLPICSRSKDVIEFIIKPQWFVKCHDMAARAADAVRTGQLTITPDKYNKNWFNWLDGIKDWCISRQLWWGHQLPFYHCGNGRDDLWVAARDENKALNIARKSLEGEITVKRDSDLLDTWFSSALLPFSSLGWIKNAKNFNEFYPLNTMITGHDILFFWVARMTMLGLELTDKLPFKHVFLHSVVCDSQGRKMSKSLGNVVDPIDIVDGCTQKKLLDQVSESNSKGMLSREEMNKAQQFLKNQFPHGIPYCGADALRFTLLSQNLKNVYINFNVNDCHGNKLFCNKIWNATRFAVQSAEQFKITSINLPAEMNEMDKWILSRLSKAIRIIKISFRTHDFHAITTALRSFLYGDLCDLYLESMKPLLNTDSGKNSCSVLLFSLENALRCLSPLMPFISETLYRKLPSKMNDSVMFQKFPEEIEMVNEKIEDKINLLKQILYVIRSLKTKHGINYKTTTYIKTCHKNSLETLKYVIEPLTKSDVKFVNDKPHPSLKYLEENVNFDTDIYVVLDRGLPDKKKTDVDILIKKKKKIELDLNKLLKITSSDGYALKAPDKVKQDHNLKIMKLKKELEQLDGHEI